MKNKIYDIVNSFKSYLKQTYYVNQKASGNLSFLMVLGIGGICFPLSAFNYFKAFYTSFGILDNNQSDLVRVLYSVTSAGHFLLGLVSVFFLLAITPFVSFHFEAFITKKKDLSNGMVLIFTLILGLGIWLFLIFFAKNELTLPNSNDWKLIFLIEVLVLGSVFIKKQIIYSLFFFLPLAFSQRGNSDARLILKNPYGFTLEYKDADTVRQVVFDRYNNLYIDQSETILYYKEMTSGKVKRIKVADIVSTKVN